MSKVVYEVVAITGKYTNREGVEKNRYVKCGIILQTDKGLSMKLESMPVASDGWFQLYEPKERTSQPAPKQQYAPGADINDDPFA